MSKGAIEVAARGPQRHPAEVRRRLILDAARRCIAERGLANTTLREIATTAGVSSGTITHHFASVDDILTEVLRAASERFTGEFLAEAEAIRGTRERLYFVVDANLPDRAEALSVWRLWLEYWARAAHDPRLAALHSERHAFERRELAALIRDGVATGEIDQVDPDDVAAELLGLLDGLGLQAAIGDEEMPIDRARALLRNLIDMRVRPRAA